jgi:hypothetical protein
MYTDDEYFSISDDTLQRFMKRYGLAATTRKTNYIDTQRGVLNSTLLKSLMGGFRIDQCALFEVHNGGVQTVGNNNILDAPLYREKR